MNGQLPPAKVEARHEEFFLAWYIAWNGSYEAGAQLLADFERDVTADLRRAIAAITEAHDRDLAEMRRFQEDKIRDTHELAALRADKELLDWLNKYWWHGPIPMICKKGQPLRAAIDAARKGTP